MKKQIQRRTFLEFLGKGALSLTITPTLLASKLYTSLPTNKSLPFIKGIKPSDQDVLKLSRGLNFHILARWGDSITPIDTFGFNNDFTAFIPLDESNPDEGLLWVNHEYIDPVFVSGYDGSAEKTKEQVEKEQYNVGGSFIHIRKKKNGKWQMIKNSDYNRRISGQTPIKFNWDEPIAGKTEAIGTLGNCSGGVTPWGTILTCEENYDQFYGERNFKNGEKMEGYGDLGWSKYYDYPPEHYGWVVEVDPKTGEAQKHIALGRCAHECATMKELDDGRLVVYTGDDAINQCLYKFIGSKPGSLTEGTLYVASTVLNKWVPLNYDESPVLQKFFKNQTEVLIRLREAARYVGGTPLDRPEDIEIDPINGNVLVSLTNNTSKNNYFGSILKIEEDNNDHASLTFKSEVYLAGGVETGFACPDNMAFDLAGNLWFTSDISGSMMNKEPYKEFKNNGLFFVPRAGDQAGQVVQIASAPTDAELTGPWFAPDGKTLFLSVQHPGEYSPSINQLSSHWPDGGEEIPKPAVVAIQGRLLEEIQGL
ncbi:MAG: alkaline phosphatase PhoX [Bacteroidota bacterium]